MVTRTKDQNTLVEGEWNVICDVCGMKFKSSDIRKRWDGYRVCRDDWEEEHPMNHQKGIPDRQDVPWTRPDTDDVDVPTITGLPEGTFDGSL